jgi:hypothetical protein
MVSAAGELSDYEVAMELLYLPLSMLTTILLFFGALRLRSLKGTLLLKLGFLLEIIAVPLYLGFIGLWLNEDPEFQAALDTAPMTSRDAIGFFLLMLCYSFDWIALVWLIRSKGRLPLIGRTPQAAKNQISPQPAAWAVGTASAASAMAPRLLAVAITLVLGALVVAVGGVLLGIALLNYPAGSNEFWGWMGGAFGCIFGGFGALLGTWNTYRQLEGAGDLMQQPTWNWLDRIIAGYGVAGVAALVSGLVFAGKMSQPSTHGLLLLGGIVVFQAVLFLTLRSLSRRAAQREQQLQRV